MARSEKKEPSAEQVDPATVHLTPHDLAARLQLHVVVLAQWRQKGKGPTFIRIGRKFIRYRLSDVQAWEQSGAVAPVVGDA